MTHLGVILYYSVTQGVLHPSSFLTKRLCSLRHRHYFNVICDINSSKEVLTSCGSVVVTTVQLKFNDKAYDYRAKHAKMTLTNAQFFKITEEKI